ncbi:DUF4190 domain-containing protein [Mycobacterium vicinigordonae]|uniref:DUF4190 domain-containing protein n=1 Tax=Mycobacterium vicinigordonae TaxID=1719132 RepID=A0A7D6DWK7_9MYCO|nr:DUF4190 domain-containing protein [Mycobacterium vicinigordonae]QLL06268.1 DUF4190 domain-containing protein [Mycobacterium vicinigordonae]
MTDPRDEGSAWQPPFGDQPTWAAPGSPPPPLPPNYPPPYQPSPQPYPADYSAPPPPSYPPPGQQPYGGAQYPPPPSTPAYPGAGYPYGGAASSPYYGSQTSTNSLAVASLVTSLVGIPLWFLCYTGTLLSIAAIVLGIVALNQIKQSQQPGRGMAIGGIAVGGATIVLFGILFVVVLAASSH